MRAGFVVFIGSWIIACLAPSAVHANMQGDIDQAVAIIQRFQEIPERAIPIAVMRDAKGLAILTITKVGFIGSVRGGTGIVVARTEKGWSAPSAIGTGGLGVGFQAGAQVSEIVIVLNTPAAVDAFARAGNFTLGGNLSLALGPIGRDTEASVAVQAVMYTYSRSQGIFAGVSLEGTVVGTRDQANAEYYAKPVLARDILAGDVTPPAGTQKLLQVLSKP